MSDDTKKVKAAAPKKAATPDELPPKKPDTPAPVVPDIKIVRSIRATIKDVNIRLACGVIKDGKVYRDTLAHSLVSGDRKTFGEDRYRANGAKMITALLLNKVRGFPDSPIQMRDQVVRELLAFDREQVLFELRDATVGNKTFEAEFKCSHCTEMNGVEIHPDEIKDTFVEMPDDVRLKVNAQRQCVFDVDMPEWEFKATFAHNDGRSQEKMAAGVSERTNPFEMEMELLATLCTDWNGEGIIRAEDMFDLELDFTGELQDEIEEHTFGYDLSVPCTCFSCKGETKVRVNTLDFLFAESKSRRTRKKTRTT